MRATKRMELEELRISVTEAAKLLYVSQRTLSELINEHRSVSPEMALRLGRFFGDGPDRWLNMQTQYERWHVEHDPKTQKDVGRIEPAAACV